MNTDELFKYLKKAFLTGSAKTIVVSFITLIFLPLIINQIGMEKYGLVAMTMMFGGAVIIVDFGISKTITLLLGKTELIKDKNEIIADAFLITFSLLLILAAVLAILIVAKIPVLGNPIGVSDLLSYYIVFAGFITLSVMMVNNLLTAILESYLLMHFVNVGFGLSSISFHLILFLAGILFDSEFILVSTPFISYTLVTLYYIFLIRKKTDLKLTRPKITRAKKMLPVSIKFLGISLVSSAAVPVNKYLLLILSGNPVIIGVYDLGLKIAFMANSFLNSIAQPLFGVFSKYQGADVKVFALAKKVSLLIFGMYLLGVLLFFLIGAYITDIIDPVNSLSLYHTSFLLIVFISFISVSEPFYRALIGLAFLKKAMIYKSFAIIFNVLLFFMLYQSSPLNRVVLSYGLSVFLSSAIIILFGNSNNYKSIKKR